MLLLNKAGSTRIVMSTPITADWTPPTCRMGAILPASNDTDDRVLGAWQRLPGASPRRKFRGNNWVGPRATRVRMPLDGACKDPESGIFSAVVKGGSEDFLDDLVPAFVAVGSSALVPVDGERNINGPNPSETLFVGTTCTNEWASSMTCTGLPVKVDSSPPNVTAKAGCSPHIAFNFSSPEGYIPAPDQPQLGEGRYSYFNHRATVVRVRGFDTVFADRETGISEVSFAVEDRGGTVTQLPELSVVNRHLQYNVKYELFLRELPMTHGSWYRMLATAVNGVGIRGSEAGPFMSKN